MNFVCDEILLLKEANLEIRQELRRTGVGSSRID